MISRNDNRKQRCMRTHRQLLRTKLTGKQKMASAKRGKRKSPFQDVVFEVSDDDMSPEHHDNNSEEPEAKVMKFLNLETVSDTLEISNLEGENETSGEVIVIDDSFQYEKTFDISSDTTVVTKTSSKEKQITGKKIHGDEVCKVSHSSHNLKKIKYGNKDLEEGELQDAGISSDKTDGQKSADDASISITFKDKTTANLYKFRFIKFLESFVELEVTSENDLSLKIQRDPLLNTSEWLVVDSISLSQPEEIDEKLASPLPLTPEVKPKKKKKKKLKVEKDLFIVDTNPSPNENDDLGMKYSSKFQINENKKEEATEVKTFVSGIMCFNCGSQHSLKDCKLPKDYSKINAARMKMQQQKQNVRYHLEPDQKYVNFKPGKISDKLREALELRKNQLPPYIYQMRILGYPPGWLEEAKFVHSNLDMFDSEGRTVRQANKMNQGLDPEKIVDYPGFNMPMPKNIIDEYRQYRLPQYSEKFSKENMMEFFEKQFTKQQDNFDTCDMDLDTTNEDIRNTPTVEPNQKNDDKNVLTNPRMKELKKIDTCLSSPTLKELEKQKENLLAALEDSVSSNITLEDTAEELQNSGKLGKSDVNSPLKIKINLEENTTDSEKSPALNEKKSIKISSFGTPILKSSSPYSRLPNSDNFMKDVSPVINFENLPNSTGKYEQMTEVLQKVRNTMKNLQNCKS